LQSDTALLPVGGQSERNTRSRLNRVETRSTLAFLKLIAQAIDVEANVEAHSFFFDQESISPRRNPALPFLALLFVLPFVVA